MLAIFRLGSLLPFQLKMLSHRINYLLSLFSGEGFVLEDIRVGLGIRVPKFTYKLY